MTRCSDFLISEAGFSKLSASQVMESDLITCHSHVSWRCMAELMTESGFASMLIVDEGRHLLGIVREDDLILPLLDGREVDSLFASGIMTTDFPTASQETPVSTIMEMMQSRQLDIVPVIADERLVGIVTRRDMITVYLIGFPVKASKTE